MSNVTRRTAILGTTAGLMAAGTVSAARGALQRYFVGTFTNASNEIIPADFGTRTSVSRGLYIFEFDASTGRAGNVSLGLRSAYLGPAFTPPSGATDRLDASAETLVPHSEALAGAGAGPRHLQFEPSGRFLYTSDEAASSITVWRWNESRGELHAIQQLSTLPADFSGENHPADIQVHPGGRFVYVSNRATGTLAGYRIDQRDGQLTRIADTDMGSPSSWSFVFEPSGQRLSVTLPICIRRSS